MNGRSRPARPKLPYRYTVLPIFVLACLIVLISWATGGDLRRAAVFAALYFVVATTWAWWRFKQRVAGKRQ